MERLQPPMGPPGMQALLGSAPDVLETLLDYGYRGAWKVRLRGRSYFVKADRRPGRLADEVAALRHAFTAGVPVPRLVAASLEAPTPVCAMAWVEGVALHAAPTRRALEDAGRVLRLLHVAPLLRQPLRPSSAEVLAWLRDSLPDLVEERGLRASEAAAVLDRAEALAARLDYLPPSWCHGDCQAAHFVVDGESGRVLALLDWADAAAGDPALDIAVLTLFAPETLPAILDGYGASVEFRAHVAATLPLYRAARAALAARWLDAHGFAGQEWPLALLREFAHAAP